MSASPTGSSSTSMAATCLNAPATTISTADQNHCRRIMSNTAAVSGRVMKSSVFAASRRGLPAPVRTPYSSAASSPALVLARSRVITKSSTHVAATTSRPTTWIAVIW